MRKEDSIVRNQVRKGRMRFRPLMDERYRGGGKKHYKEMGIESNGDGAKGRGAERKDGRFGDGRK